MKKKLIKGMNRARNEDKETQGTRKQMDGIS